MLKENKVNVEEFLARRRELWSETILEAEMVVGFKWKVGVGRLCALS
jgi:hypothetical protein